MNQVSYPQAGTEQDMAAGPLEILQPVVVFDRGSYGDEGITGLRGR